MRDAARIVQTMISNVERASLSENIQLQLAITKAIENIGKAASKITSETWEAHPNIAWSGMIGMQNILVPCLLQHQSR